jgi:hypothetical protein
MTAQLTISAERAATNINCCPLLYLFLCTILNYQKGCANLPYFLSPHKRSICQQIINLNLPLTILIKAQKTTLQFIGNFIALW